MKDLTNGHLRDGQIIWAVIDKQELTGEARHHLQECEACNTKVEQFSGDLQDLGREARQAVPPFSGTVSCPPLNLQGAVIMEVGCLFSGLQPWQDCSCFSISWARRL